MCVCVCVRERERERESLCACNCADLRSVGCAQLGGSRESSICSRPVKEAKCGEEQGGKTEAGPSPPRGSHSSYKGPVKTSSSSSQHVQAVVQILEDSSPSSSSRDKTRGRNVRERERERERERGRVRVC
jgi:hypothetical protein